MKRKGLHLSRVLVVLGLIALVGALLTGYTSANHEARDPLEKCKMENIDLRYENEELRGELRRYVEDLQWKSRILISECINAIIKRDFFKDQFERANAQFDRINAYQQDLARQMANQQVDEETRGAIVGVSVKLDATFAEFDRIFGGPRPPGTSLNEAVSMHWLTFGTLVKTGKFENKIVMARHALYRGMPEDASTLNSLTISIVEPQSEAQHAISFEGLREFPDLDLIILDAPSSLEAKPLSIGDVDPYRTPLVSHVYGDDRITLYSQLVQVRPVPNDIIFPHLEKDNFIYVSGRIITNDSGGPLVRKENGERKVVGFIIRRVLGKDGGGIAVKASRLLEKFEELESQRPQ